MRLTEPGLTIAYTGDTLSAAQVGSLPLHASGRLLLTHFWPGTDRELAVSEARRRIAGEMYQANGGAVIELFPFDTNSREESRVWLALMAQAAVEPDLADAADSAAQRLQSPLAARIAHSVNAGELRADIDPEHEATRLRLLRDGLALHLLATPRRTSNRWALQILDEHLGTLTARPIPAPTNRRSLTPR